MARQKKRGGGHDGISASRRQRGEGEEMTGEEKYLPEPRMTKGERGGIRYEGRLWWKKIFESEGNGMMRETCGVRHGTP